MKNTKITPVQEKIIDTIHNLIWYRITYNDMFNKPITDVDPKDFHDWIYYITYHLRGYDKSQIDAIIYLNGKHYHYINQPQFQNSVCVYEIEENKVKDLIIDIGGDIHKGFEIYNPEKNNAVLGKMIFEGKISNTKLNDNDDEEYYDLPF